MEINPSIFKEGLEYARRIRETSTPVGFAVDLTLFIYTHEELQDISDHLLKEYVTRLYEES